MTLIVGFNCRDGLVIAADSEASTPDEKREEPKSWFFRYPDTSSPKLKVGVAGSGDLAWVQYGAECIKHALTADLSLQEVREKIHEILAELHTEHIYPYNASRTIEGDPLNLIVGVVNSEGRMILSTDLTVTIPIDTFGAYGTGASLARFIVSRSTERGKQLDVSDATFLCVQTLKHAGQLRSGVGGPSRILVLHDLDRDSGWLTEDTITHYEKFTDEFDAAIQPVMFRAINRSVSDNDVNDALNRMGEKLLAFTNRRRGYHYTLTGIGGKVSLGGLSPSVQITAPVPLVSDVLASPSPEAPDDSSED